VQPWRRVTSAICGWIAAIFLVAIMMLTVSDVVMRSFFNLPIRGIYELVELLLAWTFFMALPAVYLRDDHILVNVIDEYAPNAVPWLNRFADLLAVLVLGLIVWQGFIAARDSYEFHDVTSDLAMPQTLHWAALLIGVTATCIAALLVAVFGDQKK
jgi:TRAP-type C4-dicarboxylate transport system permease small subunit